MKWMCEYYDKIAELSKRLTAWSTTDSAKLSTVCSVTGVTRYHEIGIEDELSSPANSNTTATAFNYEDLPVPSDDNDGENSTGINANPTVIRQAIVVCSGGGPGFMEAASKGAAEVPGARSIGMGITLPFEKGLNPYVSKELAFEYHYFFTRKLWMVFYCQALVVAPGGLGTMDELFEILTLRQTGKVQKHLPIILLGKTFWESVINWKYLVEVGVLNEGGLLLLILVV